MRLQCIRIIETRCIRAFETLSCEVEKCKSNAVIIRDKETALKVSARSIKIDPVAASRHSSRRHDTFEDYHPSVFSVSVPVTDTEHAHCATDHGVISSVSSTTSGFLRKKLKKRDERSVVAHRARVKAPAAIIPEASIPRRC